MLIAVTLLVTFLPVLFQAVPNPIGVRWFIKHGSTPMPPELLRKAIAVSNATAFLEVLVLGGISWLLLSRLAAADRSPPSVDARWIWYGALGLIAGCVWLGIYAYLIFRVRLTKNQLRGHQFVHQPLQLSVPLGLSAAVVEEIWRACCLIGLAPLGNVAAIAITSVAFGLAHAQRLGRAVSMTLFGLYLALLYLKAQSLLPPIAAHLTVNLGTIFLVRSAFHRAPDEPIPNRHTTM